MIQPSPSPVNFDSVLAALIEAQEQAPDEKLDLQQWTEKYPQFASELRSYFSHRGQLEAVLGPRGAVDPLAPTIGAATEPDVGQRLRYFGDYELLEEIARGGMGVVFRARQVSLNRDVAIKMILAGQLAGPSDVLRFRAEAEAAAILDHPHIVPIHEVGEHQGQHYFSMKLMDGGNLQQARKRRPEGETPKEQQHWAATLVAQVARAVHHAHQRGILHRDLKPGNILLDAEGQPHVTDFGLAKQVERGSDLTKTGAIVGTPAYMSPEQARCEKGLSTAADVYSLGSILYDLLTGQPPFLGNTPLETVMEVLDKEPARPMSINPNIDRDLETITLKCLEKAPEKRYGSAEALAVDLERWCRGEAVLARPIGLAERSWKWVKRNRLKTAVAAVSLLSALAIGLVLLITRQQVESSELARKGAQQERNQALDIAKSIRYTQGVAVADRALQLGDPYVAEKRLLSLDRDERSWEWHALMNRTRMELSFLMDDPVLRKRGKGSAWLQQLRFIKDTPDLVAFRESKTLNREFGEIVLWDSNLRQVVKTHDNVYSPVSINLDGTRFASASKYTGPLSLRDVMTGEVKATLNEMTNVHQVCFSPDGKLLAICLDKRLEFPIVLWEVEAGKERCRCENPMRPTSMVFSPDGKQLLTTNQLWQLKVWETATGKPGQQMMPVKDVRHVAIHPNGRIVTGTDGDKLISWDMKTGGLRPPTAEQVKRSTESVNKYVVRTSGFRDVCSIAYTPDGRYLILGHNTATERGTNEYGAYGLGSVRILDTETDREMVLLRGQIGEPRHLAFDAMGRRLAWCGNDDGITVCELDRLNNSRTLPGSGPVDVSPDGKLIAWCDGQVHVADARHGGLVMRPLGSVHFGPMGVAFSHDGKRVAGGNVGGSWNVPLWDLATGKQVGSVPATSPVHRLAFSHDDKQLIVGYDKHIEVFDVASEHSVFDTRDMANKAYSAALSPDGKHLAVGIQVHFQGIAEGRIQIWDLASRRQVKQLGGFQDGVTALAWNPDSTLLAASAGLPLGDSSTRNKNNTQEVLVWETSTWQQKLILEGHAADVNALLFSTDGKRLFSASSDATVKVWNLDVGLEVMTLRQSTDALVSLAQSDDGSVLAAGGIIPYQGPGSRKEQMISVWQARPLPTAPEGRRYPFLEAAVGFKMTLPSPIVAQPRGTTTVTKSVSNRSERSLWENIPMLDTTYQQHLTSHGPNHVLTRQSRKTLALAYWATNQLDRSIPLYESSYQIDVAELGREHTSTLMAMANLGINYHAAGRSSEALPLLEASHQASMKEARLKFAAVPLIECYLHLGKHEQAAALHKKLLDEARATLAPKSTALATQLSQLAGALLMAGKPAEAEPLLREALLFLEKEPQAWGMYKTRALLGISLCQQQQYTEAEKLLVTGYEGLKQYEAAIVPRSRGFRVEVLRELVRLYEATAQPEKAKRRQEELRTAVKSSKPLMSTGKK